MTNILIEHIEWDSRFFGYPVGKIVFNDDCNIEAEDLNIKLMQSDFHLIYIFAVADSEKIHQIVCKTNATFINQRILFEKIPETHKKYLNTIAEYNAGEVTTVIKSLALAAGIFSRFKIDIGFTNNEFDRLYTEWITKSVHKEIARNIFVATDHTSITGLITLETTDGIASIGLLSVDEQHHGKKIAMDLVHRADNEAYTMGCQTLKVATQFENKAAMNLYQKCGFTVEKKINVYHFWNDKFLKQ